MKRLFQAGVVGVALLVLLFMRVGRSQEADPLLASVEVHRDVEYANVGGKPLTLDIYLPGDARRPMPLIVWIHGGGWRTGSKNDFPLVLPLVKAGFAIASINYRLSQEAIFPAQIYDCKAAVRWLRAHAGDYGLNPDRIGAAGASAGGHLVALLGTTANHPELEGTEGNPGVSSAVQAVFDFFGPTDFLAMTTPVNHWPSADAQAVVADLLGGPVAQNPDKARQASPLYYVSAQSAPFYIVQGDQDPLVPLPQSIALNDALQKAGVASTLYVVKGGGHGGFHDPAIQENELTFFTHYLKGP
jgi:acetyl esterase/lipase